MARKTDSYGLISSALLVWMRYYWERQILQYPSKPISKLSALIGTSNVCSGASLMAQRLKHLPPMQETRFQSLGGKMPWKRKWQSTPVFLPGESPGRRSLVGYSPQGRTESDTTEWLHLAPWKNGYEKPEQCIKIEISLGWQSSIYSQSYGFSSSHVWIW